VTNPEPAAPAADPPDWVHDAVFYEIFPDRFYNADTTNDPPNLADWEHDAPTRDNFFGGDLLGIASKLPYLEELGINALYLTPIFAAGTNHRYDTHDYRRVDPLLGDLGSLRELVQDAHARQIRILLDCVFNHVGDGFWAFKDLAANGPRSRYRDWFVTHHLPIERNPPNYQTCGGADYLPKLNTNNPEVRQHLLKTATHWIDEADIDGWRLDVPWKIPLEFWQEFRRRVKEAKPDAYILGEAWWSWGDQLQVTDGLMNYKLRTRILDFCLHQHIDAEDLAIETQHLLAKAEDKQMLNLLGSHDTPRLLTLAENDESRVRIALAALFTFPGTPMIYYGDEIGLQGANDPDCRRPMQWNPRKRRTDIHELVRTLIRLRRERISLRRGDWTLISAFNRVLTFSRKHQNEETLVVLNAGQPYRDFDINPASETKAYKDALTGTTYQSTNGRLTIPLLPGRSALVLT
jgi:cyclomaltodextrinase